MLFYIPTSKENRSVCVLNSELSPISRCRAVTQFKNGTYDIIVASDEKALEEPHLVRLIGSTNRAQVTTSQLSHWFCPKMFKITVFLWFNENTAPETKLRL